MGKVKQMPSKYCIVDGKYCIIYHFKIDCNHHYFSDIGILWESFLGEGCKVNLSADQKEATYIGVSDMRATKYSQNDVDWLFRDILVLGFVVPNKTPDKYKVERY